MHFDVHFWESICFILLVLLSYRPVKKAISNYLDDYAKSIEQKVKEAENLCEEATHTLQYYTEQHKMFTKKINDITKKTEKDIRSLEQQATKKLEDKIKAKQQIQKDRLELYNKQEIYRVKKAIINKTMTLVTCYLEDVGSSSVTRDQVAQVLNVAKNKSITFH
ncbi:MAG: hypothetical protein HRU36_03640 [Rickettsiales bacterium]|nr:hypothetical protein [Rickettsiales bacterium]